MREKILKNSLCVCDVCACTKSLHLCLTLCDPMDCSPPGTMGFSRQEYWSGLPCPLPGDLVDLGIKPASLTSNLHWQAGSLPLVPPGKLGGQKASVCVCVCVCVCV